ncbi:MAG: flavodoxin domain-containing protein [candidate division KSB1 bacterium]|nr:flavodoxin domain-containing protein [candidate division KSB1 bacterium]
MERRKFFKLGLMGMSVFALTGKTRALEFYPKPSDKKWAVLYGTWCGTARDAVVWISEGMGGIAEVFDIREQADLKRFDHIVIGSAIRGMKIHPLLQEYIEKNKAWLSPKVRGLYIVCGNMAKPVGEKQKEQYIDNHLAQLLGVKDVPAKAFDGRMTKILLEDQERKLIESLGLPLDWDNLKRSDCLEFGKIILNRT